MRKALLQARLADKTNEVPVGAVIVCKDEIIARAYNQVEAAGCQCAHAEVLAIKRACKKLKKWRLNDCWIYVTLEPCLMCLGLIQLSRLEGIVYGAKSPLFGFGSVLEECPAIWSNVHIEGGIMAEECSRLLRSFFLKKRRER